jgi:hypothetical protein
VLGSFVKGNEKILKTKFVIKRSFENVIRPAWISSNAEFGS